MAASKQSQINLLVLWYYSCRSYKSGQTCRIKCSHTCLAMYAQTNVGLLCCVDYGSRGLSRGATVRTMTAVRTARATIGCSISGIKNRIFSCQSIQIGVRPIHFLATGTGRSALADKAAGERNWQLNSICTDSMKYSN